MNPHKKIFFCLLGALLFSMNPAHSKDQSSSPKINDPISARLEIQKGETTIGEPLQCKIIFRYKKEIEILSEIREPEIRGFEIKDQKTWSDHDGSFQLMGKSMTLTAFQLGHYIVEPAEVSYRVKGATTTETIRTNSLYVTVKSVAAGEEKNDIRDVKGVVPLPYPFKKYILSTSAVLFLMGAIAAYFYFRNRNLLLPARAQERLSPRDQALRDLHELFESTWIRDGKIKNYYLRLSEILKIYLEKQFGVQTGEATTSEIMRMLKRVAASDDAKAHLLQVLEAADFAKFAKWIPSPADIISLNKQAESVIAELSSQPDQPVISNSPYAVS